MGDSTLVYGLSGLVLVWFLRRLLLPPQSALSHIPTIGYTIPPLSLWSTMKAIFKSDEMVKEGYRKYKGTAFKIPDFFRWHVIVSGHDLVEELRRSPEDMLNINEASMDTFSAEFTIGLEMFSRPYHLNTVRLTMTRNMGALLPIVRDELEIALAEAIPVTEDWTAIPAMEAFRKIVFRTNNRLFVGLPLCRNEDFEELNIGFATDVVKAALVLQLFPRFLKPVITRLFTNLPNSHARGRKHLGPVITERLKKIEEYGLNYPDKPNDLITWLIEDGSESDRNVTDLTTRILTINFASIHTTSMNFVQALYVLAAFPEYIAPLREEVERVTSTDGWEKTALHNMHKVDSFLKEALRYYTLHSALMTRKALKDCTLVDGTFIPAGTVVSVAPAAMHHDEGNYQDAHIFNPWRFSDMREGEGGDTKHQMVSTSSSYTAFGHGKHACPGRFLASNSMKSMLAHVILTYDIKMEQEGIIPEPFWFSVNCLPNPSAKVMFRKRQT